MGKFYQRMTAADLDLVSAAVDRTLSQFFEAMKQLDLPKYLDFYVESDELVMAADGNLVSGRAAFEDYVKKAFDPVDKFNYINLPQKHIAVLCPDSAVASVEYDESFDLKTGETNRIRGSWIYVFRRDNGVWKIVHMGGTHVPVTK